MFDVYQALLNGMPSEERTDKKPCELDDIFVKGNTIYMQSSFQALTNERINKLRKKIQELISRATTEKFSIDIYARCPDKEIDARARKIFNDMSAASCSGIKFIIHGSAGAWAKIPNVDVEIPRREFYQIQDSIPAPDPTNRIKLFVKYDHIYLQDTIAKKSNGSITQLLRQIDHATDFALDSKYSSQMIVPFDWEPVNNNPTVTVHTNCPDETSDSIQAQKVLTKLESVLQRGIKIKLEPANPEQPDAICRAIKQLQNRYIQSELGNKSR